jgi:glycosyltransferase involved in cell wall biosynthesis
VSLALDSIEPVEPGVGVFVAIALVICAALVPPLLMSRGGRHASTGPNVPLMLLGPLGDAPKFSVIVPTFNRASLVLEAVQSVLAQTYTRLELIVVNDGSTDDTVERLRRVVDPRLSVVTVAHGGVSAARNAGLAVATGTLVSFLDSDDLWLPDKLAIELDFLRRHPDIGLVFGDLEKYDGIRHISSFMRTTDVFSKRLPQARTDGFVLNPREMYLCLLQEVPVKTPAMTVRHEVLAAVGGFDELWTSSEDWELLLRLAWVTAFGYVDRPLAVIRVSPDSLHRLDQERGDRAMLRLLTERRRHAADAETREAAARGIVRRSKHLGWYYVDCGRRIDGATTHLRSLVVTGKPSLLLRAGAALVMPRHVGRAPKAPIDTIAA